MNTPILFRVTAFAASIVITLTLFQSVALMGHPAPESTTLIAQITPVTILPPFKPGLDKAPGR